MAIVYWKGAAAAVAQVSDGTVDTFDAASTYTLTIGGYTVSVAGDTDTATTAANLVSAANASTHPYFAQVTWSVPSGSTVRGTADTAGVPFVASLTVAGGTGTVTDFSTTTAATGPHHADATENWSSGALPAASDEVIIADGPSILYALDQVTNALATVEIWQTYTGLVGLEPSQFATSLDGATTDASVPEYRGAYLELTADEIVIGRSLTAGAASGSARLCIEQKKAGASTLYVEGTSLSPLNSRPAVRYKAANASADVVILEAPGGVGVAIEPGETSTVGDVFMMDRTSTSSLRIGDGTTLTNLVVHGGDTRLAAAATITKVQTFGGDLAILGLDYLITTLEVNGGTVVDTHEHTGGAEWTTIDVYGGDLHLPGASSGTRSYTTLNLYLGRVEADWERLSGTEAVPTATGVRAYRAVEVTD